MTLQHQADGPVVEIRSGRLRGSRDGGILRYLGIPYAEPVSRFVPPQPRRPWEGVFDAVEPGPCAPHRITPIPVIDAIPLVGEGGSGDNDYLRLNIWAPEHGQGLPVMVWIHGGGFVIGSKDAPVHDGSSFARSGVVCVAINYRMGIDGFLPVPGVPTNLGLRDMLFALEWVRDSIAAFGGDPGNVTVFGESAGAMAIADLVTSPLAEGLFRRAIVQSGHGAMVRDIGVAQRLVQKLAKILRIAPTAEAFRDVPDGAALDALEAVSKPTTRLDLRDDTGREPVFGISRFIPVMGDDVLPRHPHAALKAGAGSKIDVLIGTNSEEMNLYFVPTGVRAKIGRLLAWYVISRSQPKAWRILRAYGMGKPGTSVGDAFTRAMTDLVFRWPARQWAAAHQGRTWMYEFDWRSPACGGELGACHAMDVPFVFKTLAIASGPQGLVGENPPYALADRIHDTWVEFARDGTLPWGEFNAETREVHQLETGHSVHEPAMPAARYLPE